MIGLGYVVLYPVLYMVSNAFKPVEQYWDPSVICTARREGSSVTHTVPIRLGRREAPVSFSNPSLWYGTGTIIIRLPCLSG